MADGERPELLGSYNTDKASNFMIVFEKCNKKIRKCKSERAIKRWLEFKYFIVLNNEKRFNQDGFNDESVHK